MPQYEFCVALKISHPNIKAQVITNRLDLEPTSSHDVGDIRVTPKGRVLEGVYGDTYWSLDLCDNRRIDAEDIQFEEFIEQQNKKLAVNREFFDEIRKSGGVIEYFVGWFSSGSINMNIFLEPKLMKSTADLNISIVLCASPDSEET
ncbi:hypothetical protein TUM4644_37570 [Shewanella colwelliana]|uniref:DUF4279 domain-containing protein n=1 Tax=Shewanella colwelliana TaxID=23 RepID=UPI001BC0BD60|nr:DUF4279 domain-containing protein [Shewanella colwelliana]GIU36787.1 hypothetical protein TUM4644_37570 [Shewanella colwelliana]